jgi:hypothetical protein
MSDRHKATAGARLLLRIKSAAAPHTSLARACDELTAAAWAWLHITTEVVNPTWHHVAAIASVGCGGGMRNAVKRPAPDHDGKDRHAAWR